MPIGTTPLADGHHIPNLAFGTGSALYGHDAQDSVKAALDAGFRHIDTAQAYQNEKSVGDALEDWLGGHSSMDKKARHANRDKLWVTTKYSGGDKGPLKELEDSLERLGLEYVDLYLIHQPRFVHGNLKGAWREMEAARERGLARSIGVSNFDAALLEELLKVAKVKPSVNQIRLHPYLYQTSLATLTFCQEHGIVVEAYGSLFPIIQVPNGSVAAALKGPSKRLNASPGQVLFLWVRAKKAVVVTTTSKEERLKEYLRIGELEPLTDEGVRAIDTAALADIINARPWANIGPRDIYDEEKRNSQALIQQSDGFRLAPALIIATPISIVGLFLGLYVKNEGLSPLVVNLKTIASLMSCTILLWVQWKHLVYSYRKWRRETARARLNVQNI